MQVFIHHANLYITRRHILHRISRRVVKSKLLGVLLPVSFQPIQQFGEAGRSQGDAFVCAAVVQPNDFILDYPAAGENHLVQVLSIFLCKIFMSQFFEERQIFTYSPYRV
jgi:hypothetical protein